MNATSLLQKQHRQVESILDKLEDGADPTTLLKELATNLTSHMAIEQDLFYPAVRQIDPDLVGESFEEHAIAELALKRLLKTPPHHPQYAARVSVLKELVSHHVKEEESSLFPEIEKTLRRAELEALGGRLEAAFAEARKQPLEALLPDTFAHTSADEALALIATEEAESAGGAAADGHKPA